MSLLNYGYTLEIVKKLVSYKIRIFKWRITWSSEQRSRMPLKILYISSPSSLFTMLLSVYDVSLLKSFFLSFCVRIRAVYTCTTLLHYFDKFNGTKKYHFLGVRFGKLTVTHVIHVRKSFDQVIARRKVRNLES